MQRCALRLEVRQKGVMTFLTRRWLWEPFF